MGRRDHTSMGGAAPEFPKTRWSTIREARDQASPGYADALDRLCRLYWKPVYAYVRAARAKGNEEAKDLTQEFLVEMMEGRMLSRFRPERGTFRNYLRGALRLFLKERHREDVTLKRGGGRRTITIDDREARLVESLAVRPGATPEDAFERQWAMSVIDHAVGDLRAELTRSDRETWFKVYDLYELNRPPEEPPSYDSVAGKFGIRESDVSNYLTYCRRRLRELILSRIRDYADTPEEVAQELARHFSA